MPLTPPQRKQLEDAFRDAFRSRAELTRIVRYGLDENLDDIVDAGPLATVVFNLIDWADRNKRLGDLINAARAENPGNPALKEVAALDFASPLQTQQAASPQSDVNANLSPGTAPVSPPATTSTSTDIGIVFALAEEFAELYEEIESRHTVVTDPTTGNYFYRFEQPGGDTPYRCVATFVGEMGPTHAALVTQHLIQQWKPDALVMVGIAGGTSSDIRVGDVVVANQVDAYIENAKAVAGSGGTDYGLSLSGEVYRSSGDLVTFSRNFPFAKAPRYRAWREQCARELRELVPAGALATLLERDLVREQVRLAEGHIASGPIVGGTRAFTDWLRTRDRKYLALEMEAAGLLAAVHTEARQRRTLILRGISDYGDERKKDLDAVAMGALRRYAVRNAIHLLWAFLDAQALPR